MKSMELHEGAAAFERFRRALKDVLAVPHAVIQQRIAEHRAEAETNPRKRGPKRKVKPSASSPGPVA